jgi:hypothetical protein
MKKLLTQNTIKPHAITTTPAKQRIRQVIKTKKGQL